MRESFIGNLPSFWKKCGGKARTQSEIGSRLVAFYTVSARCQLWIMSINQNCHKLVPILFFQLFQIWVLKHILIMIFSLNYNRRYWKHLLSKSKGYWTCITVCFLIENIFPWLMLVRVILVLLSRWDKHFKLGRPFIGKLWEEISKFPSPDYWNTSSSDDLCGEELQNILGRKYKISFEERGQFCLEKIKMGFVGNIKDIPAWLLELVFL